MFARALANIRSDRNGFSKAANEGIRFLAIKDMKLIFQVFCFGQLVPLLAFGAELSAQKLFQTERKVRVI